MPNIRQATQTAPAECQVRQQAGISGSSGLPPVANRMESALTDTQHGQVSTVLQGSFVPSQFSKPSEPLVQPHVQVIPERKFHHGQPSGPSGDLDGTLVGLQTYAPKPTHVGLQVQSLVSHNGIQYKGVDLGQASQMGLPSTSMLTSLLPHPSRLDPNLQV